MLSIPLIMEAAALPRDEDEVLTVEECLYAIMLEPLTSVPMPLLSTSPVPPKHLQTL